MFYLEFETSSVLTQLDLNLEWSPWDKSWPLGVTIPGLPIPQVRLQPGGGEQVSD